MPKKVDHHERRTLIAEALVRVAADRGLEAVSLRHVAAEAGVSSGMVQHYFRTKDEMMLFAFEVVSENTGARFVAMGGELGENPSPGDQIRAMLIPLLPVDEPRRAEGRMMLAFVAYATVKPAIAAQLREYHAQMHEFVADQIRVAQAAGEAPAEIDPAHEAATLLALVEGLSFHLLSGNYSAQTTQTVLETHLTRVFGPPR